MTDVRDVSDQATELEEKMRDEAIARQRARSMPTGRPSAGAPAPASHCGDCGIAIAPERQNAAPGCTRCQSCEQAAEAQRKRGQR